jgi:hypothetical protein
MRVDDLIPENSKTLPGAESQEQDLKAEVPPAPPLPDLKEDVKVPEESVFTIEILTLKSYLAILGNVDFLNTKPIHINCKIESMKGWLSTWLQFKQFNAIDSVSSEYWSVNEFSLTQLFSVVDIPTGAAVGLSQKQYDMYVALMKANENLYYLSLTEIRKYHKLQHTKLWSKFIKETPQLVNFDDAVVYRGVFQQGHRELSVTLGFSTPLTHQEVGLTKDQFDLYGKTVAEIKEVFDLPDNF